MKYKILIIDDQEITRALCRRFLGEDQFEFIEAGHALVALDLLKEHKNIDLIICDIGLPGMSGLEFCAHKAKMESYAAVPVIALTGDHSQESMEKGKSVGIHVWLCKPFSRREFINAVQGILNI